MGGFASFLPQLIPPNKRREVAGTLEDLLAPDITKLLTPPPGALENIRSGIASPLEAILQKVGLGSSGGPLDIGANAAGGVGGPTGRGTPEIAPPRGGGGGAGGFAGLLANIPLLLAAKNNPAIAGGFARQGNIRRDQDLELQRILAGEQASRRTARTTERGQDLAAEEAAAAEAGRTARSTSEIEAAGKRQDALAKSRRAELQVEHNNRLSELRQGREADFKNNEALEKQRQQFELDLFDKRTAANQNKELTQAFIACREAAGGVNRQCIETLMGQISPELVRDLAEIQEVAEGERLTGELLEIHSRNQGNLSDTDIEELKQKREEIRGNPDITAETKTMLLQRADTIIQAKESEQLSPEPGLFDALFGRRAKGIEAAAGPTGRTPSRLPDAIRSFFTTPAGPPSGPGSTLPQLGGPQTPEGLTPPQLLRKRFPGVRRN